MKLCKKGIAMLTMAAMLGVGMVNVGAETRRGAISINGSGLMNYVFTVRKNYCSLQLNKDTSNYGMWGRINAEQSNGYIYKTKSGKVATNITKTIYPIGDTEFVKAHCRVCYYNTESGWFEWVNAD